MISGNFLLKDDWWNSGKNHSFTNQWYDRWNSFEESWFLGNFLTYFSVPLQIHPGALKQGGIPLVACCVSAAEQANVGFILYN